MTDAERDLLVGIAEALTLLLRSNERSWLAYAWEHETTPSDRLAHLIANVCAEGERAGHSVRLSTWSMDAA
ncbi:MAG: hypothetical protein WD628_04920 [Thermomicrobiales bacterium]